MHKKKKNSVYSVPCVCGYKYTGDILSPVDVHKEGVNII